MLIKIITVVELLAAPVTLQIVLILHLESPLLLNQLEWRLVTDTNYMQSAVRTRQAIEWNGFGEERADFGYPAARSTT